LELDSKTTSGSDKSNFDNKIFDVVLNLNSLNQNKDALGNLKKKAVRKVEKEREMKSMDRGPPGMPP
jgi:hypothetical protein